MSLKLYFPVCFPKWKQICSKLWKRHFRFGHCTLLFFCLTQSSVAQLGHDDDTHNKFLPISAMLKFAQRLMSLTSGLLAQNILWVGVSFSQCDTVFFLKVFKPFNSFFCSGVFRARVWEQKGASAKSSSICSEISGNLNYVIWDFLAFTLSGYFSCLTSFIFSKTSQLLCISI